jgi:hypothetical protein
MDHDDIYAYIVVEQKMRSFLCSKRKGPTRQLLAADQRSRFGKNFEMECIPWRWSCFGPGYLYSNLVATVLSGSVLADGQIVNLPGGPLRVHDILKLQNFSHLRNIAGTPQPH